MANDTAKKKNVSGEDLDVPILYPEVTVVPAGATVDVPLYYPWHTEDDPAPIVWPDALWADVKTTKKADAAAAASDENKE